MALVAGEVRPAGGDVGLVLIDEQLRGVAGVTGEVMDGGGRSFRHHVAPVCIVMGVAVGADYAISWPLLAEFAPARLRGKLLAFKEAAWYVGYLFAYAVGHGLSVSTSADWNLILGLSTVPHLDRSRAPPGHA
ncbi:MFS transporter [Streptomyces sp. NPDC055681]